MTLRLTALAAALLFPPVLAGSAHAADKIKVGFVSTLSGPGAGLGVDIRDGFNLAMKQLGGKLGNLPAEVIIADEPTANLDTALSKEFMSILEGFTATGKTVLLTSHDPLVVDSTAVHRVVGMRDGRLTED